jgi:hypothetical protein
MNVILLYRPITRARILARTLLRGAVTRECVERNIASR